MTPVNQEYYEVPLEEDEIEDDMDSLEAQSIDINDPRLTVETAEINALADAYAKPAMAIREDRSRVVIRLENY